MIGNPIAIVFILVIIEVSILGLSRHGRFKRCFGFLPAVFWIYFVPMAASTLGLIDGKSAVYSVITAYLLPASLVLLLVCVDIKSVIRLGRAAILMFFAGSMGIILGGPAVFFLFKGWVGAETWSGFGALSGSWMGGSANMIAVKEALGTPDRVFMPMVIVDTIVPYVWMGILLGMAGIQGAFDRWNGSDREVLEQLSKRAPDISCSVQKRKWDVRWIILIAVLAIAGSLVSQFAGKLLPEIKYAVSTYAWTIIIVSCLGIFLSFTPVRRLEKFGASEVGYFVLYFVLTSIGAKASMADMGSTLVLILAGFLMVVIHAGFVFFAARLMKAPLFLAVTASQANIGGVASAPIVAAVYQPGLASVGLLLAILGNIVGTYLGILSGQLCFLLAR